MAPRRPNARSKAKKKNGNGSKPPAAAEPDANQLADTLATINITDAADWSSAADKPSSTPSLLMPHGIPPEVLDAIISRVPLEHLAPLVRVNSEFYLVAKPHLYRTVNLSPTFDVLGPNHPLGDCDTAPFSARKTPRPRFRKSWLTKHTTNLVLTPHTHSACAAFHKYKSLPPLPHLRTLQCPIDVHCIVSPPNGRYFDPSDYKTHTPNATPPSQATGKRARLFQQRAQCPFYDLSFANLVHHDVTWARTVSPILCPPPDLSVEQHIFVFTTAGPPAPEHESNLTSTQPLFAPWLMTGENYDVLRPQEEEDARVVAILPALTAATTPATVAGRQAMVTAYVELADAVLQKPRRGYYCVGGFTDPRSPEVYLSVEDLMASAARWDPRQSSLPERATLQSTTSTSRRPCLTSRSRATSGGASSRRPPPLCASCTPRSLPDPSFSASPPMYTASATCYWMRLGLCQMESPSGSLISTEWLTEPCVSTCSA